MHTSRPTPVTSLPHRFEKFGHIGWTVRGFATPQDAAAFFTAHPDAAMPCWRRMDVIDGQLMLVR